MKIQIETCERWADSWLDDNGVKQPKYHAQIKDKPGIWSCGKTPQEAVGGLIMAHPDKFKVEIAYLGKQSR